MKSRREYDENDINSKPWRGWTGDSANRKGKGNPQTRNSKYVYVRSRATSRTRSVNLRDISKEMENQAAGGVRGKDDSLKKPRAQEFEPQTRSSKSSS